MRDPGRWAQHRRDHDRSREQRRQHSSRERRQSTHRRTSGSNWDRRPDGHEREERKVVRFAQDDPDAGATDATGDSGDRHENLGMNLEQTLLCLEDDPNDGDLDFIRQAGAQTASQPTQPREHSSSSTDTDPPADDDDQPNDPIGTILLPQPPSSDPLADEHVGAAGAVNGISTEQDGTASVDSVCPEPPAGKGTAAGRLERKAKTTAKLKMASTTADQDPVSHGPRVGRRARPVPARKSSTPKPESDRAPSPKKDVLVSLF